MRYELTDHDWAAIKSMLPSRARVARMPFDQLAMALQQLG